MLARCTRCLKTYSKHIANVFNHSGYCSMQCKKSHRGGNRKPKKKKPKTREQLEARRVRRAKKKAAKLERENRLKQVQVYKKISLRSDFFETREWQTLRYKTLMRYGRKCMCCGASNTELHVDHIKPRSKFPELSLDPENLQVLCRACNYGKGAEFQDDFRPKT